MKSLKLVPVLLVTLLLLGGISVMAAGSPGSPTANIGEGRFSVGYDYSFHRMDTATRTAKGGIWAPHQNYKFRRLAVRRNHMTLGYGVSDELDVYARLGATNIKERYPGAAPSGMGNDLSWGMGARYTFLRQDNIEWGSGLQVNWIRANTNEAGGDRLHLRGYDMLLTVGPTVDLDVIKVYGGGYCYYMRQEYTMRSIGNSTRYPVRARTGSMFGGFVGAQYDLPIDAMALSLNMDLASSFASDWSFGTGLALKF